MSPQDQIADLDFSLREDGEDIVLRRSTPAPSATQIHFDVACRAFVKRGASDEIEDTITERAYLVLISPTEINASGWPGATPVPAGIDKRVPRRGDVMVIQGRVVPVVSAMAHYRANVLVRIDLVGR